MYHEHPEIRLSDGSPEVELARRELFLSNASILFVHGHRQCYLSDPALWLCVEILRDARHVSI